MWIEFFYLKKKMYIINSIQNVSLQNELKYLFFLKKISSDFLNKTSKEKSCYGIF